MTSNVLGKGAESSQWQVQHFLPANVPFGVTNSATRLEYGQHELEILLQHVPYGLNRGKFRGMIQHFHTSSAAYPERTCRRPSPSSTTLSGFATL